VLKWRVRHVVGMGSDVYVPSLFEMDSCGNLKSMAKHKTLGRLDESELEVFLQSITMYGKDG
jgi:hypothetical protein